MSSSTMRAAGTFAGDKHVTAPVPAKLALPGMRFCVFAMISKRQATTNDNRGEEIEDAAKNELLVKHQEF